ncbi:transcription elongation factor 1 homolog [Esox lucius]|uniref:Transcription elongation factor 1 homolog n=1 Tax=Esox lucius TaxID=8010 RepID=A0A6Q2YGH2_ESOLU|nr:transcription elongation factor 1 homolog [Esox lucius]
MVSANQVNFRFSLLTSFLLKSRSVWFLTEEFSRKVTREDVAMGRRKSKRKPPPKKKLTGNLDTQFTCPFCNHEKSCDVKMERARNTGIISCTVCLEEFQTPITYLSEPVDVYSDWIDACEAANQ